MDRRKIFGISAMGILGMALQPRAALAQGTSVKEKLVGVWSLVSIYDEGVDGKRYDVWGEGVQGITVYSAGGHFTTQIISANRDKTAAKNPRQPVGPAIGYFGTYVVDEAAMTIAQHLESSTFPGWVGYDRLGKIDLLTDDEAHLSGGLVHDPVNGDIYPRAHYKRVT